GLGAGKELVEGQGAHQAENAGARVDKEVTQHFLDFARGIHVLISHKHFVIEVMAGTKIKGGCQLPTETPENSSFTWDTSAKRTAIGQEQRAPGDKLRQVTNMFEHGDGCYPVVTMVGR